MLKKASPFRCDIRFNFFHISGNGVGYRLKYAFPEICVWSVLNFVLAATEICKKQNEKKMDLIK